MWPFSFSATDIQTFLAESLQPSLYRRRTDVFTPVRFPAHDDLVRRLASTVLLPRTARRWGIPRRMKDMRGFRQNIFGPQMLISFTNPGRATFNNDE
jgi:hypothetical protein